MKLVKYPLVMSPFVGEEVELVKAIIDSGQWTMGAKVREFETAFAKKVGSRFAVMVNSGSSANLAAVSALFFHSTAALKRGDEVLVPAIGWATTWAPLQQLGLKVRVVDINPDTLNCDVEAYEQAITPQTKMIVTVSVLGNPLDFTRLRALCTRQNLLLLEDNCESIAATHAGKWCGTFGVMGTFSFFYSHHIATAEGGMVITDDEEFYQLLLAIRAHGWNREIPRESPLNQSLAERMKEQYQFLIPGYNLRPMEICGVLGLCQLPKLDKIIATRRANAVAFAKMMEKHPRFRLQRAAHGESSWFSFTLVIKNGSEKERNHLFEHLSARGIESRMITGGCFTCQPMSRYFDYTLATPLTNAIEAHDHGLFVANHGESMSECFTALDEALARFSL